MLSDTLSGLELPASKPRSSAAVTPPPISVPKAAPPRSAPPAAAPAKNRFDQYQLMERIATGGMAEVFKAKMSGVDGFQKIVAIKKILPHMAASDDFITMFADEAKLAAQLNHPNIIHIYDLGKADNNSYYIAMEYVEGRDLRSILKSAGDHALPLPAELALFIAAKIASALDYAHRRKDANGRDLAIVHRDVSPQNVLISDEGDIKLCDFGIAKAASKSSQTQAGALKGKLQYMSPEQASGLPLDKRSDIFSLGAVLYEMLVGEKLFAGDTDLSILDQVRTAHVAAPSEKNPDVPKKVDQIVLKALARDPEVRYQNASDMLRDLDAVLYGFSPTPGSADLAIYLHHLKAEERAVSSHSEEAFDRAFAPTAAEDTGGPRKSRKSKGAVARRRTGTQPGTGTSPGMVVPVPEAAGGVSVAPPSVERTKSGVFGTYSSSRLEAERKSRRPLFTGIGIAAAVLIAVAVWLTVRKPSHPVAVAAQAPTTTTSAPAKTMTAPAGTTAKVAAVSSSAATPARPAYTQKDVQAAVQKQLDQKRAEMARQQAAQQATAQRETSRQQTHNSATAPPPVVVPTPTPLPVAAAPTAVPVTAQPLEAHRPAAEPAAPPSAPPAAVTAGQLVGPGPGVVEPSLVSGLRVNYNVVVPQRVTVLVLIDENGRVESARLQGKAPPGLEKAVLSAVRSAQFRPATKDGVPVKMYKAISIEVKPS